MLVRSLWFADALEDSRLKKAARRLRLSKGQFSLLEAQVKTKARTGKSIRMFFAEGPKGGVQGILLAYQHRSLKGDQGFIRLVSIGVYVERGNRRKGIGSTLVQAARNYYPRSILTSTEWNESSLRFWSKLKNVTSLPCR